jgi:hypothetical protein
MPAAAASAPNAIAAERQPGPTDDDRMTTGDPAGMRPSASAPPGRHGPRGAPARRRRPRRFSPRAPTMARANLPVPLGIAALVAAHWAAAATPVRAQERPDTVRPPDHPRARVPERPATGRPSTEGAARPPRGAAPRPAARRYLLAGGLAAPSGDFAGGTNLGVAVTGGIDFRPSGLPFGLRMATSYQRFGVEPDVLRIGASGVRGGSVSVVGGQLDGVVRFGAGGTGLLPAHVYRPYLLGGLGVYRAGFALRADPDRRLRRGETVLGFGIGGGLEFRLGGREAFAEARYQNARTDRASFSRDPSTYLPILVGVRF